MLRNLFQYDPALFQGAQQAEIPQCYFPGIQVMTVRQTNTPAKGLFLAAKGGTNAESHNHNDIGHYIVYLNGQPCLCDAGVEAYSRKTFSPARYELWTMQSGYHNTVNINGYDQCAGSAFAATDVSYRDGRNPSLSMNMGQAYPPEAQVIRYRRKITLHRESGAIMVLDDVALHACEKPLVLPLLCACEPQLIGDAVRFPVDGGTLQLSLPKGCFVPSVEAIPLSDSRLQQAWGLPCLYRLLLTRTQRKTSDTFTLTFRAI
ncbi:MAG: heparinase II/III family protein [Firmicutes bacterium]|nr:heparinase II/III family protein [Bacillota bacterium]